MKAITIKLNVGGPYQTSLAFKAKVRYVFKDVVETYLRLTLSSSFGSERS